MPSLIADKTKIALATIGWATVSCALTLCIAWPTNLHADGSADGAADRAARSPIAHPTLMIDGVEVSVQRTDPAAPIAAGEFADLQVVAKNASDRSVTISPTVMLMTTLGPDRRSRVGPVPREVCRQSPTIALSGGETRTISLASAPELAGGSDYSVMLSSATRSIVVMRFTTPKS